MSYATGLVMGAGGAPSLHIEPIRTAIIMDSEKIKGYLVVQTLSSRYVVCDWAGAPVSHAERLKLSISCNAHFSIERIHSLPLLSSRACSAASAKTHAADARC